MTGSSGREYASIQKSGCLKTLFDQAVSILNVFLPGVLLMPTIKPLQNSVREYAWGSYTAIPDLLGVTSPSDVPWAELWMGAHEQAPSRILDRDCWRPLNEVIAERPEAILGRSVTERSAGRDRKSVV